MQNPTGLPSPVKTAKNKRKNGGIFDVVALLLF
jgi:hypothetical protein